MEKEILLSLAHNANAQIKNEITELDDEIIFLNTKLGIDKDNTISNIVKARCNKRKEKKSEELNNFFFKYIMFLLSNKSNDNIGDIDGNHFYNMIKKNAENVGEKVREKNDLLTNQHISNTKRDENFLKCMYEKKDDLEQILELIKLNDLENLSDKKSQDIFSNLMLKLKNMDNVKNENILNVEDVDKEINELNISENLKQKLLKYLFESINDPNGKTYDLSTAPSTVSLVDTTSEKESDSEWFTKYNNMGIKLNEFFKNNEPTFNTSNTNRSELYGKNNNTHNISYNRKSPSFGSIFLKKGSHNILLNKFNASRKSFSESRQNGNKSCLTNEALMRKKKKKNVKIFNDQFTSLPNQTTEKTINMSDSESLIKMNKCENNLNYNNKDKSSTLNKEGSTGDGNKNNKNRFSKGNDKNDDPKKVNEDMTSSFSSSSSESNSIRKFSEDQKTVGFKKLCLKINEEGKGYFTVSKKKGKNCSKYIYDFEIVYENGEVPKQNECNENMNEKDEKKNIFHLSFLTNGKKVYKVNNLHMEDLKITNNGKNGKINIALCQNKKGVSTPLDSKKENEDKDNLSESDTQNDGNTNRWNKYEVKRIGSRYRQRKKLYSQKREDSNEFRETNKIRGLYIHMLDRQNQLEVEKEFYKKEYDKLQEDIKNNTAPINEYLKEEKLKHFEREKLFYKKEKQFIKKKNLLKKKMLEIENQLEIVEKKLAMEKEKNENLCLKIQDEKYEIEKRESVNESKIKNLNLELEKLNKSILLEQKEKDDLLNKLNILKDEDIEYGNFRKNVLDKVNKTNSDIKYLAEILEVLTKELEKKNHLQNLNEKKIKELEENSQKTENLLRITKDKLLLEKKKKKNLFKEITHLNKKNKDLGKCIKDLMFRQNSEINFKKNEMNLTGFSSDYEQNQNKKSTLLYDSTSKTNVSLDNDNYNTMLHYKIKYNCNKKKNNSKNGYLNNSKDEHYPSSDKDGTIVSDNSSLFLFNPNTKNKISYSDLIESMDDLSDVVTPALKHNIVCNFKAR
ncbi:conserved Plasmodium protein, unknown function [Plasmodium chabaudi chabaudi]|uniref:Uncharacterized protein n=1 Tax=Plasmodium chabaudi chabaudi TaxID=31271 RepID=A0A1D3RTK6_PLACU|nr:conserved Plasmodium protein, unknown function [Plasmodium chabaudi chabaudi]